MSVCDCAGRALNFFNTDQHEHILSSSIPAILLIHQYINS